MKRFSNTMNFVPTAAFMFLVAGQASAAVHCVPNTSPGGCTDSYATIQAAITASAASGDTIKVAAGTYVENLTLNKSITFIGAQAGVDARGRVTGTPNPATESIIAPASGVALTLLTGSAGSTINGFSFLGGTRSIESQSGPLDNLQILNDSFTGFTANAVFLNDPGTDITVNQNSMNGASQTGTGDVFHLDTDVFNGFQFTNNDVMNSPATGFFVDGNHNVGVSVGRAPAISGNLFQANDTGANLGSRSFGFGSITGNTFQNNAFDGLQGGPQHTTISTNVFLNNGRSGLALTSFGSTAADRGAQSDTITCNSFRGNQREGIFLSSGQAVGTMATNTINQNNIFANVVGLTYAGTETINAENNYWGSASGPTNSANPGGTGDIVAATTVDFVPWAVSPVVCVPLSGQPDADLSVTKTPPSYPFGTNTPVTWTITVSNVGTQEATDVSVTDVIPPGTTFVSANPSQGSCTGTTTVTCTMGSITSGSSATIALTVMLPSTPGTVTNTATATTTATDPNPANNTGMSTITVIPAAEIPTVSQLGLMLIGLGLALAGWYAQRS